ncbi:APO protein 3, mitochondrial isoform X1 [Euphorbia lathyris]|uniref:APO protein 3, mitochondrial isoform X1 n=1 Tax=Euphorbia lathyris TaxID=212925 RepID=UPI0033144CEF
MQRKITSHYFLLNRLRSCFIRYHFFSSQNSLDPSVVTSDPIYADIPKRRRDKGERKPYQTPINVLIRRAKLEKEARKANPCRMLENPPGNGLLVPELVEVAHSVYLAQQSLFTGLTKLVKVIPVQRCRCCSEVHIGHVGNEIRTCIGPGSGSRNGTHVWRRGGAHDVVFFPKCFHLYDRVGKPRVGHDERRSVPRIPAILELCIQAGVDLGKYPTKRRTKPVYSIEGRIVDFEQAIEKYDMGKKLDLEVVEPLVVDSGFQTKFDEVSPNLKLEKDICHMNESNGPTNSRDLSIRTMESWLEMISGAKKIMERYSVLTCGYCPEVQVGPKGHKVRLCKATKHQARDGQHAWQEATIEDLVGPNYVWHVEDTNGPSLDNKSKRYYGKAPAVVELCVQNGAPVPDQYRSMMRLDVVSPNRDEVDLVA